MDAMGETVQCPECQSIQVYAMKQKVKFIWRLFRAKRRTVLVCVRCAHRFLPQEALPAAKAQRDSVLVTGF